MLDELVTTKDRLHWWIEACKRQGIFGFDTETTGLQVVEGKDEIVGWCLAISPKRGCYIPVAHVTGEKQLPFDYVADALAPILEDPKLTKVAHNFSFDYNVCAMLGIHVRGYEDTQLMSYALDGQLHRARGHGFDALTKFHFNYDSIRFEDVVIGELGVPNFAHVRLRHACAYASEDARKTLALYLKLERELEAEETSPDCSIEHLRVLYEYVDRPLATVVADMKRRGVKLDRDKLAELDDKFHSTVAELQEEINDCVGREVNVNSPKDLARLLYDELDLPLIAETESGAGKTNKDTLALIEHEHPVVPLILKHSKFTTLKQFTTAWTALLDDNDRIHPGFGLTTTNTRRLSGYDPNLQNVPARSEEGAEIRKAFVAPDGRALVVQDMSQIEYRVLAHVSQQPFMVKAFNSGFDFHAAMAAKVLGGDWKTYADKSNKEAYGHRSTFKNVNFAVIYGAGPKKVAGMSKISEKRAYQILDDYAAEFPEVMDWKASVIDFARKHGYAETLFGGRIHVPTIRWSDKGMKAYGERQAVNGVVQGTAADMMRLAMSQVSRWLAKKYPTAWLLLSVHDELVIECDEDDADAVRAGVKRIVETCADHLVNWSIPILSEGGHARSWGEAK